MTTEWTVALRDFEAKLSDSDRSEATVVSYMLHLTWLSKAARCGPWALETAELNAWLDDHNWSTATRRKVLVSLRIFYATGINSGLCERSPLAGMAHVTAKRTGPRKTLPTKLWVDPIADFLRTLEAGGRSAGTLRQRRIWLTNLSHMFADPWKVTAKDLSDHLARPDWSGEYKRSGRTTMRRFYKWALRSGYVEIDPSIDLEPVLLSRRLPRPTPDDEVLHAFTAASERTRLAIELAMYAGLRIGEVAAVRIDDIADDRIRVCGKGGHERVVPLHPDLRSSIRAELSRRDLAGEASPWLFPSPYGGHLTAMHLGKHVSAAFAGHWTAHPLRHRFASQAYAATRDLRAVQELLGHSKPETTAIYAAIPGGALVAAVAGVGFP